MMQHTFYVGDTLKVLKTLPESSVQCCVTSPPYWGLRDYHVAGQVGLEASPEEYIDRLVEVFAEVRRVLRKDGTLWLNLGDCYAGSGHGWVSDPTADQLRNRAWSDRQGNHEVSKSRRIARGEGRWGGGNVRPPGYRAKQLLGLPWRVALALQADGWWLRSDIIWSKPNPMPESVVDRPTRSHEYIFLLSQSERYFYDADAIREPQVCPEDSTPDDIARALNRRRQAQAEPRQDVVQPCGRTGRNAFRGQGANREGKNGPANREGRSMRDIGAGATRNKRDVWTIPSQPFPGAHFAVFPEGLVKPCILAGTSERGCCPTCGAPWRRVTEKQRTGPVWNQQGARTGEHPRGDLEEGRGKFGVRYEVAVETVGWEPTCSCGADPVPCVVLDPFGGSGTTSAVAKALGRSSVYIDLNPEYADMAIRRMRPEQQGLVERFEVTREEIA